ncbi:uncharacterized protein LOC106658044 [Trichogramma pretiosum]|uniref:uncharacterized protein LOC106658044 n=1 Tax=Trichogramma pretiosum TaxID=7493 RepID=UPI000C719AC3|nr:uncharacterized protein LOC106658044 [Trichogramma pretiosum]
MGGTQFKHLNQIAREIWQWCEARNIIIIASYISSKNNVEADEESRKSKTEIEYELADWAFLKIVKIFGAPQIDLFASRLNHKCNRYFSWGKDPDSEAIDAFTQPWNNIFFYAFPPFNLILKQQTTPIVEKAFPGGRAVISEAFRRQKYPAESIEIGIASIESSTIVNYEVYLRKWWSFCNTHNVDCFHPSVQDVISFLHAEFDRGLSSSALNVARSAISLIVDYDFAGDFRLKRFLKGCYKARPSKPKYNYTWDPKVVLNFFKNKGANELLTFKDLSRKVVTLLALVTGQRIQTLSLIKIENIKIEDERIVIFIPDRVKNSQKGVKQPVLYIPFYIQDVNICPASALKEYLNVTLTLRGEETSLFLSLNKGKKKAVCKQSLSNWVRKVLTLAGIDSVFTAHSTRHSSNSAAKRLGTSIDTICKTAGWSKSSATFARFYNREIIDQSEFALSILNNRRT